MERDEVILPRMHRTTVAEPEPQPSPSRPVQTNLQVPSSYPQASALNQATGAAAASQPDKGQANIGNSLDP